MIFYILDCSHPSPGEVRFENSGKPVLGVVKTQCNGLSYSVCSGGDGEIIKLLNESKKFQLVDRSKLNLVLKEITTQQLLGLDEVSKLGKLLAADKILTSSLNRISKMSLVTSEEEFQFTISMVDVARSNVEYSHSENFFGYSNINNVVIKLTSNFLKEFD